MASPTHNLRHSLGEASFKYEIKRGNPNEAEPAMKPDSKWMPAPNVLVVMSMMTAMVEPVAFTRNRNEAQKREEPVTERIAAERSEQPGHLAAALPQQLNRPLLQPR